MSTQTAEHAVSSQLLASRQQLARPHQPEPRTQSESPQRLEALARANAIRIARAELKRAVAAGEMSAAAIVRDCPEPALKWPIGELLLAQHRWGRKRCASFLDRTGLSAMKQIGALTERQRLLVVAQLTMLETAVHTRDLRLSEHSTGFDLDIRPVS